jgi:hypothetical protein
MEILYFAKAERTTIPWEVKMKMKGPVVGKKKEHERYEENTDGFD